MSFLTYAAAFLTIIFAGLYLFFKKKFAFFKERGIPYIEPSFPLGNLSGMGTKYHMFDVMMNIYNQLRTKGKICGFFNLFEHSYIATDIEVVKAITVKDFNKFVNRGNFLN